MAAESDFASSAASAARRQDAYYWRLVATGASFLLFGLGALVVGAVLLPTVVIIPAARERKRARVRGAIRVALRLFIAVMRHMALLTYEFRGLKRLGRPGQLIVANHPSLIDVVFLLAFVRGSSCVVKQGLWRNPLTRGAVTLAGYIANDSTAAMIAAASNALRAGQSLIIFPEGTRTTPGASVAFHRGAANVALRAASVVTPVYIRCEPPTLTKAEAWHRIPPRRPRFTLVAGADLDLDPWRAMRLPAASRALNEHLQARFKQELSDLS